jgi:hypothetical protein
LGQELAQRLRQETTMTLSWIAEKLNKGAAGSLANLLRHKGVVKGSVLDIDIWRDG